MPNVSPDTFRRIRQLLSDAAEELTNVPAFLPPDQQRVLEAMGRAAKDLHTRTAPRAAPAKALPLSVRSTKPARLVAKREHRRGVREAVMARANGHCEDCLLPATPINPLEMDHFFGRRRESVEECWALHRSCHFRKTDNEPSRSRWLVHFRWHCERKGLPLPRECRESEAAIG